MTVGSEALGETATGCRLWIVRLCELSCSVFALNLNEKKIMTRITTLTLLIYNFHSSQMFREEEKVRQWDETPSGESRGMSEDVKRNGDPPRLIEKTLRGSLPT